MQKMVITLAIMFAMLIPATSFAQTQKELNQQVAQAIADKLSDRFPEYTIHVRYNNSVATLMGELYSSDQVNQAAAYVESLPGVTKVINNLKVVQQRTLVQPMPVASRLGGNNIQTAVPSASVQNAVTQIAATEQPTSNNVITQASGQMRGVTDFAQQVPPPPVAPAAAAPTAPSVIAPVAPTPTLTPAPTPTMTPAPTTAPAPAAPAVQVSYVEGPQEPGLADFSAPIGSDMVGAPVSISTQDSVSYQGAPYQAAPYQGNANFSNMPLPMGQQTPTAGRYDQPNVPNYAWPSYAAPNNYSEVAYPRLYCPQAAPYIGPFYPYPQVPMGWRKVTLEWHDGYWWLDFDDGSAKGPFSPLFRQPNPKRY